MNKKTAAVAAAEEAVAAKAAELAATKEAVQRLEREHSECVAALRQAQTDADAALPQCDMVSLRWRSNKEEAAGRMVILRKTPGGMLVTRRVGDASAYEYRFKWSASRGKYAQAEKRSSWVSDSRELRSVPVEYVPA